MPREAVAANFRPDDSDPQAELVRLLDRATQLRHIVDLVTSRSQLESSETQALLIVSDELEAIDQLVNKWCNAHYRGGR